jgi:hypothetical protein
MKTHKIVSFKGRLPENVPGIRVFVKPKRFEPDDSASAINFQDRASVAKPEHGREVA